MKHMKIFCEGTCNGTILHMKYYKNKQNEKQNRKATESTVYRL